MSKNTVEKVAAKPEPNLTFVGKRMKWNKKAAKLEKVPRQSPAFVINGRDKITLPEDLHKGAFVAPSEANVIKQLFSRDFKDFKKTAGK